MPKFVVDVVSMFRMRYVIECENAEHAMDTAITVKEVKEFGQKHIGENIVSCREIADDQIPILFFEDHPYLESWGPSIATEYVHKVDYSV